MTDPVSGFTDPLSLEQRTRLELVRSAVWLRQASLALEAAGHHEMAAGALRQADRGEEVLKEI